MKAALLLVLALAATAAPQKAQTPAPDQPPARPAPKISLPPAPPKPAVNDALGQCRTACARARYMCLQENDGETCNPAWTQCRADCLRANPN